MYTCDMFIPTYVKTYVFPFHSSVLQPQPIGTSGDSARVKDWFVTCVRSTLEKLQDRVKVCTYIRSMGLRLCELGIHVLMQCTFYMYGQCTYIFTYVRTYAHVTHAHLHTHSQLL